MLFLVGEYAFWAKRFQTLEIAAEICYVLGWVFLTLDILFLHLLYDLIRIQIKNLNLTLNVNVITTFLYLYLYLY